MSTTPNPQDVDLLAGSLALEPHLPGPADVPPAQELTDTADLPPTVGDTQALAALLTGGGDLRVASSRMVAAGADPDRVRAAVDLTDTYTRALADLLRAVDHTVAGARGARVELAAANARLAQLEQGRGVA